jgi:hypothetical protein
MVIMLGVLTALFVDTWLEDRENDEREAIYRALLIEDLQTDVRNITARTRYYKNIREHGLLVLRDLDGKESLDDFNLLFSAFNAAEEWDFSAESSTFIDMQSTGGLLLLDDLALRLGLASYYREMGIRRDVWTLPKEFRALARGIIPSELQADIHGLCNQDTADIVFGRASGELAESSEGLVNRADCQLDPTKYEVSKAVMQLRNHPDAASALRYRMSQVRVSNILFEAQITDAMKMIEQLKAE